MNSLFHGLGPTLLYKYQIKTFLVLCLCMLDVDIKTTTTNRFDVVRLSLIADKLLLGTGELSRNYHEPNSLDS